MDTKEFSMKMEHLKKLVAEKDYATALRIVESIDWNRVKSPNLLALASSVYEENDMLEEAKDTLVIALERSSGGKRILYKLTELAVRSGNVKEAEEYFEEYKTVAGGDPASLLLQYMIMKVKHTPYPQLIQCLEMYNDYEPDEKWMYELATTYESAGRIQDCVALCDRIALMFGNSTYGVKALKLKQKYAKLTEEQRTLIHPHTVAEGVRLAEVGEASERRSEEREAEEVRENAGDRLAALRIENEDALFEAYLKEHDPLAGQNVPEELNYVSPEELKEAEGPVAVEREEIPEAEAEEAAEEPVRVPVPVEPVNEGFLMDAGEEEEAEEVPAAEEELPDTDFTAELPSTKDPETELLQMDARIADEKLEKAEGTVPEKTPVLQARPSFTVGKQEEEPAAKESVPGIRLILEALEEEEGVEIAKKELACLYRQRGETRPVAKSGAEKLNGFSAMKTVFEKIGGRDLVIVKAGDLDAALADELYEFFKEGAGERSVILVDTPEGLDKLEDNRPELFDICDILTDEDAREKDYGEKEEPEEEPEAEEKEEKEEKRRPSVTGKGSLLNRGAVPFHMPASDDEVMEYDDFAQYCLHYAGENGCSITGKAVLALYEKIEIMEEDGIALNAIAAEDCIEEAAEHAEHPGMKGLFRKKYDKDDMLILREEDFIN